MDETWRQVPWAATHEVSDLGRVRKRIHINEPWKKRTHWVLRGEIDKDGYHRSRINGRAILTHRLVYSVFCGDLIPGLVVCHLNGNRTDNRPSNLLQTTQRENISHKLTHGTHQAGEKHGMAKYADAFVRMIKQEGQFARRTPTGRLARGECVRLAKRFQVPASWVSKVVRGRAWGTTQ